MGYRVYRFRNGGSKEDAMNMLHSSKEMFKRATEMMEEACEMLKSDSEVSERNGMYYRDRDSRGRYMSRRNDYGGMYGSDIDRREDYDEMHGRRGY